MSGGEVMVIVIVAMLMVASILKSIFRGPQHPVVFNQEDGAETKRLREEVVQLKNRIKTLERIVTDAGAQTAAQIEALRENDRIDSGDKVQ